MFFKKQNRCPLYVGGGGVKEEVGHGPLYCTFLFLHPSLGSKLAELGKPHIIKYQNFPNILKRFYKKYLEWPGTDNKHIFFKIIFKGLV